MSSLQVVRGKRGKGNEVRSPIGQMFWTVAFPVSPLPPFAASAGQARRTVLLSLQRRRRRVANKSKFNPASVLGGCLGHDFTLVWRNGLG